MRPRIIASLLCLSLASGAEAQLRAHRTLSVKDGLAHSQVLAIGEDEEGFLWFGTEDGVSRFDGLEMVSFREEDGLPGAAVRAIFQRPGGPLLFGTSGGLALYENGRFSTPPAASGLTGTAVRAIAGGADGSLFFGTDGGGIVERPDGGFAPFPWKEGTPLPAILDLLVARDGTLYAGTSRQGLLIYRGGRLVRALGAREGLPGNAVHSLGEGPDGTIYVGTGHGLALYRDGAFIDPGRGLGPDTSVPALAVARDGTVFFGTHLFGMFLGRPGEGWRSITSEHGLTWGSVLAVHPAREGTLYIGTERGVGIYEPRARVETWSKETGLYEDSILSLAGDPAGGVYAGTGRGVLRFVKGRWVRLPPESDLRYLVVALHLGASGRLYTGNVRGEIRVYEEDRLVRTVRPGEGPAGAVFALQEGAEGLFAGTDRGLFVLRQGRWTQLLEGRVGALAPASEGGLYVGAGDSLLLYREGAVSRRWTGREGLPGGGVRSLRTGRGGSLYVVTARDLSVLRDGRLQPVAGLGGRRIFCLAEDEAGRLFASTRRGIEVLDPAAASPPGEILTPADGLAAGRDQDGACDRDGRGRLWFGFTAGVSAIEPRSAKPRREPSRVRLDGLEVAGREVPLPAAGEALTLASRQSLTVSFLVIDLVAPRRVRYRYRLAGEASWNDTPLRSVHFPQLAPGGHTFEVQAANESAVWGAPARLGLRVDAPFYERRWFLPLLVLAAAGLLAALLAYRARSLLALERLRTAIAADLHDQIGSGLTEIAILSEMGESSRAAATARELTARMSDVVWLVNPRRDTLHQLFLRLKDSYADLFAQAGVSFRTVDLGAFENVHLPMSYRQNLYAIFREALHNALRHGEAREIELDVKVEGRRLQVTLQDDGRGFDPALAGEQGDGLANMQRRAAAIGGRLALDSTPGGGTAVRFDGPLRGGA